ncbi:MAG: hypothetical protein HKN25_01435 [Pyrinomonadaceae bacterium]|nr:hypothetical protein [Pyrinomonadaceae bacterium]
MSKTHPLIIAHRGASALAPENTLAAFRQAIDDGAEGIEFDVRLSKDRIPVVFHDSRLIRICERDEKVSDLTYTELRQLDIGSWFNAKNPALAQNIYSGSRIESLENTLKFLSTYRGVIYIELKCDDEDAGRLTEAVCKVIETSPLLPQMIVKSFNLDVLPLISNYCSTAMTAALFAPEAKTILRKERRLIDVAKELKASRLSLHFSLATKKLIKKADTADLPVTIWTADSPRWVKRSIRLGIDQIITNDPARLLKRRYDVLRKGSILV